MHDNAKPPEQVFFYNPVSAEMDYAQWMFLFGILKAVNQDQDPIVQLLARQIHEKVGRLA